MAVPATGASWPRARTCWPPPTPPAGRRCERYCAAGSGLAGTEVEPAVLADASSLGSGTRALAVYDQRWQAPAGPLCVYLHGVRDPGNVGAVLRSAAAFGVASVVLGPHCADPYGPRAVRASMGAVFEVAAGAGQVEELPGERVALVSHEGQALRGPAAGDVSLLVGAEREGLPADVVAELRSGGSHPRRAGTR